MALDIYRASNRQSVAANITPGYKLAIIGTKPQWAMNQLDRNIPGSAQQDQVAMNVINLLINIYIYTCVQSAISLYICPWIQPHRFKVEAICIALITLARLENLSMGYGNTKYLIQKGLFVHSYSLPRTWWRVRAVHVAPILCHYAIHGVRLV